MEDNQLIELRHPLDDQHVLNSLQQNLSQILSRNEFVDCTLWCQDGQVSAHRIILAAGSTSMHSMLSSAPSPTPCSHPVLFFKPFSTEDMKLALKFIYTGKVHLQQNKLPTLMSIARELDCIPMIKAIEKAVQTYGIEIFRQRVQQSQQQMQNHARKTDQQTQSTSNKAPRSGPTPSSSPKQPSRTPPPTQIQTADDKSSPEAEVPLTLNIKTEMEDIEIEVDTSAYSAGKSIQPTTTTATQDSQIPRERLTSSSKDSSVVTCINVSIPEVQSSTSASDRAELSSFSQDSNSGLGNFDIDIEPNEGEEYQMDDDGDEEEEMPISVVSLKSLAEQPNATSLAGERSGFLLGGSDSSDKTEPASCPWCFQVFTNPNLLQKHIRTHVGTYKPFACPYCSTSFARSAHLKRHIRMHTGEKPYSCSVCSKAFARQDKLKTHLERHFQNQKNATSNPNLKTALSNLSQNQNSSYKSPMVSQLSSSTSSPQPPSRKPINPSSAAQGRQNQHPFSGSGSSAYDSRYVGQSSSMEFQHFMGSTWQSVSSNGAPPNSSSGTLTSGNSSFAGV